MWGSVLAHLAPLIGPMLASTGPLLVSLVSAKKNVKNRTATKHKKLLRVQSCRAPAEEGRREKEGWDTPGSILRKEGADCPCRGLYKKSGEPSRCRSKTDCS